MSFRKITLRRNAFGLRFLLFTSRYRSTLNVMVVCGQTKHLLKGKLHVAAAESWSVPSLPSGYFSRGAI